MESLFDSIVSTMRLKNPRNFAKSIDEYFLVYHKTKDHARFSSNNFPSMWNTIRSNTLSGKAFSPGSFPLMKKNFHIFFLTLNFWISFDFCHISRFANCLNDSGKVWRKTKHWNGMRSGITSCRKSFLNFLNFSLLRSVFFADPNSDWTFTDAIWATTEKENGFPPKWVDFQELRKLRRASALFCFSPTVFRLSERTCDFVRNKTVEWWQCAVDSLWNGGLRVDFAHALTFSHLERA